MFVNFFRLFGGYVIDIKEWIKEVIKFGQVIGDISKYYIEFFYIVGYDSLF